MKANQARASIIVGLVLITLFLSLISGCTGVGDDAERKSISIENYAQYSIDYMNIMDEFNSKDNSMLMEMDLIKADRNKKEEKKSEEIIEVLERRIESIEETIGILEDLGDAPSEMSDVSNQTYRFLEVFKRFLKSDIDYRKSILKNIAVKDVMEAFEEQNDARDAFNLEKLRLEEAYERFNLKHSEENENAAVD